MNTVSSNNNINLTNNYNNNSSEDEYDELILFDFSNLQSLLKAKFDKLNNQFFDFKGQLNALQEQQNTRYFLCCVMVSVMERGESSRGQGPLKILIFFLEIICIVIMYFQLP